MQKFSRLVAAATAVALLVLPFGVALAQGAPGGGAAPAPAAPIPAPEASGPENAPAENAAARKKMAAKKKKPARMTRQQEIDRSIDGGTVPARYRNSVPKEYHQYIPFDKQ